MGREQGRPPMLAVAKATARAILQELPSDVDLGGICLDLTPYRFQAVEVFRSRLSDLHVHERNYWIGTLYTLMVTQEARRRQAAYFTPPYLAEAVIDLAVEHGFDLLRHDVLDPAAGGAAFLSIIAARMRVAGAKAEDIAYRLNGVEIDNCLAEISEHLIAEQLDGFRGRRVVETGDSLHATPLASYNLVIANPPYGRITPNDLKDDRWTKVAHMGHINKYAVFTELCLRVAKPRGLVALVIPSSFRGGPLYDKMRSFIAGQGQILALGTVTNREDVFADVAQDISVLLVRKGSEHRTILPVNFPDFTANGIQRPVPTGSLPSDVSAPWLAPADSSRERGGATIADYGVVAKAGYFVWNREQEKFCNSEDANAFPLIWAKNVRPGQPCVPANRTADGVDFVRVPEGSQAVVSSPALVIQRTSNSSQPRRIIAAAVDKDSVARWKGFVSENHTIIVYGPDVEMIDLLAKLLNTRAVDERYRAVSGTATVSVKLLRELDLPLPEVFRTALRDTSDPEAAAMIAYKTGGGGRLAEVS
ncbi:N-6 DNA methylase [Agrobacterium deltaense NCPPB 1641]|uniref:site-specific DNA-methyltransferase (adenine-specific) n=2 Tax=Rhizobium/Agrobacterium group TaxID=227290 RepID=A0A1S7TYJ6_9HYPH|nr:N-6 DNA methylase [Agrobacterium deltaense NCPPB 1641]